MLETRFDDPQTPPVMRWTKRRENGRWPPEVPKPSIPTRADVIPTGSAWIHEVKQDGYRLLVRRSGTAVRVITRGGYDWTTRYPAIVAAALRLPSKEFVLDGEGVVEDQSGVGDFKLLHSRKHDRRCHLIALDLVRFGSRDLKPLPLEMRKSLLATLLEGSAAGIVYADIRMRGTRESRIACHCVSALVDANELFERGAHRQGLNVDPRGGRSSIFEWPRIVNFNWLSMRGRRRAGSEARASR